jgi:PilZ domain
MADIVERRAWPRVTLDADSNMARGKLRPGRLAHIVDMSAGGALVETECRLLPGMRVEFQVGEPIALYNVKARILRCHVARLDRERVRYRGALVFDERLLVGGNKSPGG